LNSVNPAPQLVQAFAPVHAVQPAEQAVHAVFALTVHADWVKVAPEHVEQAVQLLWPDDEV
jgi:hypothetical protein